MTKERSTTYLEEVRQFLKTANPDLTGITLQAIRYALHDIIGKARSLRWQKREIANRLQSEIPSIFRLKARKLASLGPEALADEMLKVRRKIRDPERINIYDQLDLDCMIEIEKTLPQD